MVRLALTLVRVWDIRKAKAPVTVYDVQSYLTPKLYELYESEVLFDRFELGLTSDK